MKLQEQRAPSLLLFISGFAILSLEMVGIRILGPYTGITVPVWAALLSVALAGSALGYWLGGALADRAHRPGVLLGIAVVAALLIAVIPFLRHVIAGIVEVAPYGLSSFLASLFLFFAPITCLGALVTYSIRISLRKLDTIAQVHGDLYALATIGSVIGVFGTSYLLIPLYTIPTILYGLSVAVFVASLYTVLSSKVTHES